MSPPLFTKWQAEQRKFYESCLERGLEPFYNKMVEQGVTKQWSNIAPNLDFKLEIIDLIERYEQKLPVTEFTDEEQWYLAIGIDEGMDGPLIAMQSLIQNNLTDFQLGEISPYSYRGDLGSPMLLYKAKNNRGFALLNSYLKSGETLDDFEVNDSVKELLKLSGTWRRSQAHVPDPGTREFYINVKIPPETLMLENLALQATEINYITEGYGGRFEFQNPNISIGWQDVPESLYIMYALGKTPFRRGRLALNYPGGI
tara:strand:+ start:3107 stop:3877 length:771 start_codon:yes stop_codon:yes gene_type:complete